MWLKEGRAGDGRIAAAGLRTVVPVNVHGDQARITPPTRLRQTFCPTSHLQNYRRIRGYFLLKLQPEIEVW